MATSSGISSTAPSGDYHRKVCDLYLDTIESLEVNLQHHNVNLSMKCGTQNSQSDSEYNNAIEVKSETIISAPADSTNNMIVKPSSECQQRATSETSEQVPHSATPQSYHSAPSPYQHKDQTNFSPVAQFGNNYLHSIFSQNQDQMNWKPSQYNQECHTPNRIHPYNMPERVARLSSSSPLLGQSLNQMTSPLSLIQSDKCGFVSNSAMQHNAHCNTENAASILASSGFIHYQQIHRKELKYTGYQDENKIIQKDEVSADVLNLDSQKDFYHENEVDQQNISFQQAPQLGRDMHIDKKMAPYVQMPPLTNINGGAVGISEANLKPSYPSYDSPMSPQISSSQPSKSSSSTLPSINGKGANWKFNEARRPKTHNCSACNKWYTTSGHLKRHYNTTIHKNAVRSSGQPDPATMPISSHHYLSRGSSQRAQQKVQTSPVSSEDIRCVGDNGLHTSNTSLGFEYSHHVAAMQSPYMNLQQGNLNNSLYALSNQALQHPIKSASHNVGQPSELKTKPKDNNHLVSKTAAITKTEYSVNGEAGPSIYANVDTRDLLSVSTPIIGQTTALTAHALLPFSNLSVNSYSPRSTDSSGPSAPDPTLTPSYSVQNLQQTLAPSYPNGIPPHVMNMAIKNLPIANTPTFGESLPEEVKIVKQEMSIEFDNSLPSFDFHVSNYNATTPDVGGPVVTDEPTGSYIIINPVPTTLQLNIHSIEIDPGIADYEFNVTSKPTQPLVCSYSSENVQVIPYGYAEGGKILGLEGNSLNSDSSELKILKIENVMDYTNKENYESQMKLPASPESAKTNNENQCSPAISPAIPSSTWSESNQIKKSSTSSTVHKCFECDKLFNKGCYLTQHNKTFHCGVKPFKCDRCGKRFSDGDTQKQHSLKHEYDKPFKCNLCPKAFNHKTDLRRHMCLHTGHKPFACDFCGKGFIRKDHMLKHVNTHKKKNVRPLSSPSFEILYPCSRDQ